MPEAKESIVIDVPKEKFFEVILDVEKYPEFLSECKACTVDSAEGDVKVVTQKLSLMKTINVTTRITFDRPNGCKWTLVKGDMMKMNDGYWQLEDAGEGKTKATYGMELKLKGLIPSSVVNSLVKTSFPKMLKSFKQRAESLFG